MLSRGFGKRCPRCGRGELFSGFNALRDRCSLCGLPFEPEGGATWAFMYLSTGGITGLFIIAMLLIRPANLWVGRGVIVLLATALIIGTLPRRKGVAVALDYLTRLPDDDRGRES